MVNSFISKFNSKISEYNGIITAIIDKERIFEAVKFARDEMKYEILADIACVDNLNLNNPKRFSLYYIFSSLKGSNFIIQ